MVKISPKKLEESKEEKNRKKEGARNISYLSPKQD